MPRTCTICHHSQRAEIEAALVENQSLRDIAGQFRTGKSAVARHRDGCVAETLSKAADVKETLIAVCNRVRPLCP